MAGTPWFIKGKWLEYCSCDWGCPCEAMAPPTRGNCTGVVALKIDEGHWGEVNLDDTCIVATFYSPRAIHHGGVAMQPILDKKTTPAQREALFEILSGKDQPAGTMFQIFSVIVEKFHEPLFLPIKFGWDIDKRKAFIDVPGVVHARTEPIRNPVTDEEHRMLTVLPDGWTFYECEVASGAAKATGAIKFDFAQRHSSLAPFAFSNKGMAYSYKDAKRKLGTRV